MAFQWTFTNRIEMKRLYTEGNSYRTIAEEVGCSHAELQYELRNNNIARLPLSIEKFAEIEMAFHARKNTSLPTPKRL